MDGERKELLETIEMLTANYTAAMAAQPMGVPSGYEFDGLKKAINEAGKRLALIIEHPVTIEEGTPL